MRSLTRYSYFIFVAVLCIPFYATAASSQLIKSKSNTAVYWVQNGARRPFPLLSIYQSWFGSDFSTVMTVDDSTLAAYPLGKNVPFNKGSLVKIQTDPRVYVVMDESGSLQWVPSEAEFKARGYSFSAVRDVPDSFFGDYTMFVAPPATPAPLANNSPAPTSTPVIQPVAPTSTPPVVVAPPAPPALAIQNVAVTNVKTASGPLSTIAFGTNQAASITLAYSDGITTSTILRDANTQFSIPFSVSAGVLYKYTIQAATTSGTASTSGSFLSYADVVVSNVSSTSSAAMKAPPPVVVAAFAVKNNSNDPRTFTNAWFTIESLARADVYYGRSVQIARYDGTVVGDSLGEVGFPSGSSGVSQYKRQKFTFDQTVAPGETRTYAVIIKNVTSSDGTIAAADQQLKVTLQSMNFYGDTSLSLPAGPLATLVAP